MNGKSALVRGVLLDVGGVLYQGSEAIPGAPEAVTRLRDAGLPIRFLTNSTRQPKRRIVEKLRSFGIYVEPGEVMTPAAAACSWLEENSRSPHLLIHPDLEEDFAGCPGAGPTAVVVGDAGPYFTYDRLNTAFREIDSGAPFIALAANRVFRDDDGELSLDAGAFVRALEHASGSEALLMGKPSAAFFLAGVDSLGCDPVQVAMVGDDAESDVAGGLTAGLGMGVLVKTGKYRDGDESFCQSDRALTVEDIEAAVKVILQEAGRARV